MPMVPTHQNRYCWTLVALATAASLPLRMWPIGRLGLNQFDEGIYAMAASWAYQPAGPAAIDPGLIPYAPPGYPILVGIASFLLGLSDQTGLLVSALMGTMTVPLVAWISKACFGHRAAAVSAWCACLSGPHLAFSRMGLTDASFLFAWTLGCVGAIRFLQMPRLGTALALGLLVGLAQQVKYNGWLVGGSVIVTVVLGFVRSAEDRRVGRWLRFAGWGGLAALIAALVVYPWFRFVENHGGYASLLKHQRSYLGGPSLWWPHLRAQASQAAELAGPTWLALLNVGLIGLSLWALRPVGDDGSARPGVRSGATGLLLWGILASPVISGLFLIPRLLRARATSERFLGVSWVILFSLTPFYHPYARLWLPFEMFHWVCLGGMATRLAGGRSDATDGTAPWLRGRWSTGALGLILGGSLIWGPGFPLASPNDFNHDRLFEPSDSLKLAAGQVLERVPPEAKSIRTLVRPSMSYYLAGRILVLPQSDREQFTRGADTLQWALVDSAVLASNHRITSPGDRIELLGPILDRWEVVAEIPALSSLPTALDLDPTSGDRSTSASAAYFWLLRRRSEDRRP